MDEDCKAEFAIIAELVNSANLVEEAKRTLLWCIEPLPNLYHQFCQSNEICFGEKIQRLEQAVLGELAKAAKGSPEAITLAGVIRERLRTLHERHGLTGLDPKPTPAATPRPKSPRRVKVVRSSRE